MYVRWINTLKKTLLKQFRVQYERYNARRSLKRPAVLLAKSLSINMHQRWTKVLRRKKGCQSESQLLIFLTVPLTSNSLSREVTHCSCHTRPLFLRAVGHCERWWRGRPREGIDETGEPSRNHGDLRSADLMIRNVHGTTCNRCSLRCFFRWNNHTDISWRLDSSFTLW